MVGRLSKIEIVAGTGSQAAAARAELFRQTTAGSQPAPGAGQPRKHLRPEGPLQVRPVDTGSYPAKSYRQVVLETVRSRPGGGVLP
jgi:hypothetical protein